LVTSIGVARAMLKVSPPSRAAIGGNGDLGRGMALRHNGSTRRS
jgi:hypothetical protein